VLWHCRDERKDAVETGFELSQINTATFVAGPDCRKSRGYLVSRDDVR